MRAMQTCSFVDFAEPRTASKNYEIIQGANMSFYAWNIINESDGRRQSLKIILHKTFCHSKTTAYNIGKIHDHF